MAVGIDSIRLTAKIFVKWVIFADITLAICMPLAMLSCAIRTPATFVGVSLWHCSYSHGSHFCLFLLDLLLLQSSRRHCKVADCVKIDGALRNNIV
jgi:uncharacterized membrane protein YkgB